MCVCGGGGRVPACPTVIVFTECAILSYINEPIGAVIMYIIGKIKLLS